jgi:ABC-type branched-subunit amino acid transport system ATPase component
LIGPNGSGKTNIMQGIMLLNKMSSDAAQHRKIDSERLVPPQVGATFEQGGVRVRLRAYVDAYTDQSNNDVVRNARQRWTVRDKEGKNARFEMPLSVFDSPILAHSMAARDHRYLRYVSYRVHNSGFRIARDGKLLPTHGFPPEWARGPLMNVARQCIGMIYYSASQFTNPATCPASFEIEREEGGGELPLLRGHARFLYDMYSAKRRADNHYLQFLDIVGPKGLQLIDNLTFKDIKTSSSDYSVLVGGKLRVRKLYKSIVIPQFRVGRQRLSPNQLSEGTFKTLALLFYILTRRSTVLLIEEPEVCVHHGLLSSILEVIKSSSDTKQIILSTHSAYVLDHVRPENVFRVSRGSSGTAVRSLRQSLTTREFGALRTYLATEGNLGDYWREGGIGDTA